jgi:drug/metabolite transporter (DMT)-like permease
LASDALTAHAPPDTARWLTGVLAGLAAGALWGMVFVTPRVVEGFSSVDVTAGRYVACGLFALAAMAFMAWRDRVQALGRHGLRTWPNARQAAVALGLSVLGYTGYYLLLALAIGDAGSVLPTLIIGTIPLWMMVLGKPEHLHWRGLLPGFVLTALGLGVMVWAESSSAQAAFAQAVDRSFWRGLAFAALAMACWTAFGLLNAAALKRDTAVRSSDWANWMGVAAGLGGLALWVGQGSAWGDMVQREGFGAFVWVCAFTGIGAAWVASVLWNMASRHLSPSLAGQLIVSETVFGVVYSFAWDGQWPALAQWLACGLFVAGILASVRAHR